MIVISKINRQTNIWRELKDICRRELSVLPNRDLAEKVLLPAVIGDLLTLPYNILIVNLMVLRLKKKYRKKEDVFITIHKRRIILEVK